MSRWILPVCALFGFERLFNPPGKLGFVWFDRETAYTYRWFFVLVAVFAFLSEIVEHLYKKMRNHPRRHVSGYGEEDHGRNYLRHFLGVYRRFVIKFHGWKRLPTRTVWRRCLGKLVRNGKVGADNLDSHGVSPTREIGEKAKENKRK